jgi:hypothetical protein
MSRSNTQRKSSSVIAFPRVYKIAEPGTWRSMSALETTGQKVKLRLAFGPMRDRIGPEVVGWRAERESGPVYFCWDKTTRSHVEVIATAWRPL